MKIHINRYPIFMRLGCYEGERERGQEVLVSLTACLKSTYGALQDRLENTTNYARILEVLDSTLAHKETKLIETAVEKVGFALLEVFPQIEKVRVHIEKPVLPNGMGRGAQISISCTYKRTPEGIDLG